MSVPARRRVLLTRGAEDNARWADALRARGFAPIECACLEDARVDAGDALAEALADADWIACTSRRGADALADAAPRPPDDARLAAVGEATAERLRARYGRCELVADGGTGADLGRALVSAGSVRPLVVGARGGLTDVEDALRAAGVDARRVELHETRPVTGPPPPEAADADAAFFASPTAVRAFAARGALPAGCAVVSLGPTTSEALRAEGIAVDAEARARDLDAMIEALETLAPSER